MRRLLPVFVLIALISTTTASAASWRQYVDQRIGFSLRYPAGWQISSTPSLRQVEFSHSGTGLYSITVTRPAVTPGNSPAVTLQRFLHYEEHVLGSAVPSRHWSATVLDGKVAEVGISSPPTEGGVSVSQGLYVVGWRHRTYEIGMTAYSRHALHRLSQFPSIYRQILATWRFR